MPDTFDPANTAAGLTLSNGNLTAAYNSAGGIARALVSQSGGKYYCEMTAASPTNDAIGLCNASQSLTGYLSDSLNSVGYFNNGALGINNSYPGSGGTFANGTVIAMAVDLTANLLWVKPGAGANWNNNGSADPATGVGGFDISSITGPFYPGVYLSHASEAFTGNFGDTAYGLTPPSGFGNWQTDTLMPQACF